LRLLLVFVEAAGVVDYSAPSEAVDPGIALSLGGAYPVASCLGGGVDGHLGRYLIVVLVVGTLVGVLLPSRLLILAHRELALLHLHLLLVRAQVVQGVLHSARVSALTLERIALTRVALRDARGCNLDLSGLLAPPAGGSGGGEGVALLLLLLLELELGDEAAVAVGD